MDIISLYFTNSTLYHQFKYTLELDNGL